MLPNLLEATKRYWQELDNVEAAYQQGDLSIQEVDSKVHQLMEELGAERRAAFRFLFDNLLRIWNEQRETVVGVLLVGILTYAWFVVSQSA